MKKFQVNYCDKANSSELYSVETLEEAIALANKEVQGEEPVADNVDPYTDVADTFKIEVWSIDDSEEEPNLEYETELYYKR